MKYHTTTLATKKNEKLIFAFFDQPYADTCIGKYRLPFNIAGLFFLVLILYECPVDGCQYFEVASIESQIWIPLF